MPIVKRIASEEYADEKASYEANEAVKNAPQSDWNQNDETAIDFIKNRPFYEGTGVTKVVLFDGNVELWQEMIPDYGSYLSGSLSDGELKEFEHGKTYTVTIENEQQDIVCENGNLIFISSELNMTFQLEDSSVYVDEYNYDSWESFYHIKIETAETSTIVKQLDEKYIPDTIARVENIPEGAIKPFPYYEVNEVSPGLLTQYKVNLEELEVDMLYSAQESVSTPHVMFAMCIICDDGTEKIVTNLTPKSVCYIGKSTKNIVLYDAFGNSSTSINISDKSTSNNITVKSNLISKWLPTNNSIEYTPTGDYYPATKKYVDDAVSGLATKEDVNTPKTEFVLNSSTEGSSKKFKITIDDAGVLTATEIVEGQHNLTQ